MVAVSAALRSWMVIAIEEVGGEESLLLIRPTLTLRRSRLGRMVATTMTDSLLDEALSSTRETLSRLPQTRAWGALRRRLELLAKASETIELRPTPPSEIVRLARLILSLREDAAHLREGLAPAATESDPRLTQS
jgi:hypothetical protein